MIKIKKNSTVNFLLSTLIVLGCAFNSNAQNYHNNDVKIDFSVRKTDNISDNTVWRSMRSGDQYYFIKSAEGRKFNFLKNYNGRASINTRYSPGVRELFTVKGNKVSSHNTDFGVISLASNGSTPPKQVNTDSNCGSNPNSLNYIGYGKPGKRLNLRGADYVLINKSHGHLNHGVVKSGWFMHGGDHDNNKGVPNGFTVVSVSGTEDQGMLLLKTNCKTELVFPNYAGEMQYLLIKTGLNLRPASNRPHGDGGLDSKIEGERKVFKAPGAKITFYAGDEAITAERHDDFQRISDRHFSRLGKGDDNKLYIITGNQRSTKNGNGAIKHLTY